MQVQVECYSGIEYAERPRAILWQGKRSLIEAVLKSWRTPEGKGFIVRTNQSEVYYLFYNQASDAWKVELVETNSRSNPENDTISE